MRTVALDWGAKKISYCEVRRREVVERTTVRTLEALLPLLGPNTPPAAVAIEACREAWHVHAKLSDWGHHPVLVDTTRVRRLGVGGHGRKTDRIDAEVLARALEAGQIPKAHVLSPERQQLRYHLGVRRALVETRAQYVGTIRHLARSHGVRLPSCTSGYFAVKLRSLLLGEELRALIAPLVATLEPVDIQIRLADSKLMQLCSREPLVMRLMTAPGVGLIVATAFVSVIDDAHRFKTAHEVEAYLGLVPSENSSGDRRRLGAITKQGNRYARSMLIEAAWSVVRSRRQDDPLKRWADAVVGRRGRSIAVVALARRIAGVLWSMWRHGTVYEPAKVGRASASGIRANAQDLKIEAEAMARAAEKLQRRLRRTTKTTEGLSMN
jgi:transposase